MTPPMRINLSDCLLSFIALSAGLFAEFQYNSCQQQSSIIMSTSTEPDNSLCAWFKSQIENLYSISEVPDPHTIFTDDARIVLNHIPTSVDDFYGEFARRKFAVTGVTIDWQHIVDDKVEDSAGAGEDAEMVAGSYIVTSSLKFRVRAAPAQSKSHIVFSARCMSNWLYPRFR